MTDGLKEKIKKADDTLIDLIVNTGSLADGINGVYRILLTDLDNLSNEQLNTVNSIRGLLQALNVLANKSNETLIDLERAITELN